MKLFIVWLISLIHLRVTWALSCLSCRTTASELLDSHLALGFNLTAIPTQTQCVTGTSLTIECSQGCMQFQFVNDVYTYALRSCVESLNPEQKTKLNVANDEKFPERCFESVIGSEGGKISTSNRLCFCHTADCNSKQWDSMTPPTVTYPTTGADVGNAAVKINVNTIASFLGLIILAIIAYGCYNFVGYWLI